MPHCIIQAHRGIGLEVRLGDKIVTCPAGRSVEETLSSDHIGTIRAYLESQEATTRLGPSQFGGKVTVPSEAESPPLGSKKWLALVRDSVIKPKKADYIEAVANYKGVSEKALKAQKPSEASLRSVLGLDVDEDAEDALQVLKEVESEAEEVPKPVKPSKPITRRGRPPAKSS